MPTLTSISPLSGPPGSTVTLTGTGFTAGSQVACPVLVPTVFVSATQLTAQIPDLTGDPGQSISVGVTVVNPDGTISGALVFTVQFPADTTQSWTTVSAVAGEVPGFQRNGQISDQQIQTWITSVAQSIAAAMLRRDLPLDPTQWQRSGANAQPTPEGILEMINRLGAAARLAAAVASTFTQGDWAIRADLQKAFLAEMANLRNGDYDKIFLPAAATLEPGPQFGGGNTDNREGWPERSFRKEQIF